MPHTLLSLNYDVLSHILPLLSPQDASQLCLASRAAYALALPRILADVTLGGLYHKPGGSALAQLTAFCNFVLAPAAAWHGAPSARLDALQNLHVMRDAVRVRRDGGWAVDPQAVALLSDVVGRARNLQKLTLWGSDALFAAYPDFGASTSTKTDESSTSIRTLVLGGDVPPLPMLARAFPHVRALEFVAAGGSCAPDWAIFAAAADAPTCSSQSQSDSQSNTLGAWQANLDSVDAGFPILPLACPVRRVELRNALVGDTYMLFCAREFLRRVRPVVLSASVSTELSEEEVGAVLDAEVVAPGLRYLELVGDRCAGVKEAEEWSTRVANALSTVQAPLLGLSLSVTPSIPSMSIPSTLKPNYYISRPSSPAPAFAPTQSPAAQQQGQEKSVDLAALARTLAEHSPELQFIALDLSSAPGATEDAKPYFRVCDVHGEKKVVKMSEEEGRETVRRMRAFNRWD
ncbi:hypothetical protein OH77DRAFT_724169 [Trametes cingulata]|nr:hypothetical protein OH77DRAFT_724169 [Trametes cingulata]